MKTAVARFPIVSAVEDDLSYDKEEMILELTPQGQVLGFTIDGLGAVLRGRLNGIEAATYPLGTRSAELRVELPEDELSADFLERMQLRSPQGEYVPLADIVSVELKSGFSTVRRENGIRLISVTGDISEDDPVAANEVIEALENEILPEIASERQVEWRLAGLAEQEDQFRTDARTGSNPVFDGHLSGTYVDFCQLDTTHNRDGDHSIRSDWNDLGALYLGYPNVHVHCHRPFGDDGDYYQ